MADFDDADINKELWSACHLNEWDRTLELLQNGATGKRMKNQNFRKNLKN